MLKPDYTIDSHYSTAIDYTIVYDGWKGFIEGP